jgi:hypothetical protein
VRMLAISCKSGRLFHLLAGKVWLQGGYGIAGEVTHEGLGKTHSCGRFGQGFPLD